jgi:hypothetical protein
MHRKSPNQLGKKVNTDCHNPHFSDLSMILALIAFFFIKSAVKKIVVRDKPIRENITVSLP